MAARHPLQPKDWQSGSHAARFERVRSYLEQRTALDVGAGSGIDGPDWMHAAVASVATVATVATLAVGVELDERLAGRVRDRGYSVVAADAQTLDLGRTFDVVCRVNPVHTCWYDETTLSQLLRRHGYEVLEVAYLPHRTPGRGRALVAGAVRSVLPRHRAENTLLVVATPQ